MVLKVGSYKYQSKPHYPIVKTKVFCDAPSCVQAKTDNYHRYGQQGYEDRMCHRDLIIVRQGIVFSLRNVVWIRHFELLILC